MDGNRDGPLLLGIEIGGTKLQLGLGRGDGRLLALERRRVEPARGARAILDQIREAFQILLARCTIPAGAIRAAGVGFGGPVDVDRGRVRVSFQVEGWSDFPLAGWICEHLGVPATEVQNDADTAGLAEALLGAGVGYSPLLYLTVGSGIGGALIVDGRIYRGCGLGAVEIGHTEVPDPTAPDGVRELEQVASGWGITRQAREVAVTARGRWVVSERAGVEPGAITAEHVAQAALEGDARALAILDRAHKAVAFALRQAIALLGPRRIILGGGVSLIGETHWFAPIRRLVDDSVFGQFRGGYEIVPAALGEEVVVHGALVLAGELASRGDSPEQESRS
jgi:glucokinase